MKIVIESTELAPRLQHLNSVCDEYLVSGRNMNKMIGQAVQMGGHPASLVELNKAIQANGKHGELLGKALSDLMSFLRGELEKNR